MSRRWTPLLATLSLSLCISSVAGFASGCVNAQQCHCVDATRVVCNCTCGGHLNLLTFMIPKGLHELTIDGCDAVAFNPMTFSDTYPRVLRVTNVRELFVRPLAFHNVVGMSEIVIRDTTVASLDLHAFTAVRDLRKLEFVNVTLGNVSGMAFTDVTDVGQLNIVDCTVDLVASGAFNGTRDVASVLIRNTTFGWVEPQAFVFMNVGDFRVTSSTFAHLADRSITLVNVTRTEFDDCDVGTVESLAIVPLASDNVAFTGCRFGNVRSDAWDALRDSSNVRFEGNHFEKVVHGSAVPSSTSSSSSSSSFGGHSMTFKDNAFTCDFGLCWLLERDQKMFETFLMDNRCSKDNSSLASFASRIDDEDVCGRDDDQSSGHDSSDLASGLAASSTEKTAAAATSPAVQPAVAAFEFILSILIFLE